MPIPLPNLDDLTFDELVNEGKRLIPGLAPRWTDHNPSDPGIAFIELFAFVAEMLMYRANAVGDADKRAFVKLLRGQPVWPPKGQAEKPLDQEIRDAVLHVRDEERAVTTLDFQRHALDFASTEVVPRFPRGSVARAYCLARCLEDARHRDFDADAHVTVLIVPGDEIETAAIPDLLKQVQADLAPRCLLTTRLHVCEPRYLRIAVQLDIHAFPDQIETSLRERILAGLGRHFDRLTGGPERMGWPFGRAVYVSELYALVDGIAGVDYLTAAQGLPPIVALDGDAGRRIVADDGSVVGISLKPDELVSFVAGDSKINVMRQVMQSSEE